MSTEMIAALSALAIENPTRPAQVLVVDDEVLLQAAVHSYLKDDGIEVHFAGTCQEGFEAAVQLQPDLILLDLQLPDGDGLSLCRRLRADPLTVDMSVIFMTVDASTERKLACFGVGAVDYITKPFVPAEMRARVAAALRVRQTVHGLARSAVIDPLSGLWNRTYLNWRLREELARAARHFMPLSCILFDIDDFKQINDRFGHEVGDNAIRHVAQLARVTLRAEDGACRTGGDEFVVLLPHTTMAAAGIVTERIRNAIAAAPPVPGTAGLKITCSFGIADYEHSGATLLSAADAAMYKAKRGGRNCVRTVQADLPLVTAKAG